MANSYLNKTLGTPTNSKKFTFSAWVKKCSNKSGGHYLLDTVGQSAGSENPIAFDGDQKFRVGEYTGSNVYNYRSNAQFRDLNAWYHCVVQGDSTQSTASDRVKLYVNNELLTSDTNEYPSQNYDFKFNVSGNVIYVGRGISNSGRNLDGYMAHVAFVDGSVVAPTVFGATDSTSGIWKFKSPSGVTWGNNGFHLKFENSGNLGLDSANSNNFTVTGDLKQALDTPSNVYATMNSLNPNPNVAYLEGNNTVFADSGGDLRTAVSTLGATSGKYYAEVKIISIQDAQQVGLVAADSFAKLGASYGNAIYQFENSLTYMSAGKIKNYNNNTVATGLATFTANDIIGIAADLDNSKIYFHKNGTYINSGVPTSGSTGTGAYSLTANTTYLFANAGNYNNGKVSWNFGNGFFGTTAITSAGSNGNGSLFEYDVPSGYYALNTKNLNTYG